MMQKLAGAAPQAVRSRVLLAAAYGALFVGVGVHLPFFPLWLAAKGLSPTEIGLVLALNLGQRIVTLPWLSAFADRMGGLKRAVALYAAVAGALSCLYPVAEGFWALLALTVALGVFWTPMVPILDALVTAEARRHGFDYGRVRLWGSIAFIAAAVLAGVAVDRIGVWIVIPVIAVSLFVLALVATILPNEPRSADTETRPGLVEGWLLLFGGAGVPALLAAAALVQGAHSLMYVSGSVHWKALGYSETVIGVLWSLSVIAEIAFFMVSGALVARIGVERLVILAASAAILRWVLMAGDPPLVLAAFAQVLHAFTFGAAHMATVNLIATSVPPRAAATAQGAYFTALGAVTGTTYFVSGHLYAWIAGLGYLVMAAMAVVALLAAFAGRRRRAAAQPQRSPDGG